MNKEEYDKLNTFDKIDYDIAMKLYFEHNDKIASINDHLGDIYGYSDLKEAEECELKDQMRMYRDALKEKCDLIDKAIEYIEEKSKSNIRNIVIITLAEIEELSKILKGDSNE